ncbi:MAG: helix-turn-helix domain-containing protein [Eubacterium sp.]|jgi:hypothetical protein|nr:helix-turn-helix domain-containing protein [Eubacterium sp.]
MYEDIRYEPIQVTGRHADITMYLFHSVFEYRIRKEMLILLYLKKKKEGLYTAKELKHFRRKLCKRTVQGYTLVYFPEHPRADRDNYVPLHIVIMEYKEGRFLDYDPKAKRADSEIVHHIDVRFEMRSDNRPVNLKLKKRGVHSSFHNNLKLLKQGKDINYTDKEWLSFFINEGYKQKEIATMCDCSEQTISNWVKKFGLKNKDK